MKKITIFLIISAVISVIYFIRFTVNQSRSEIQLSDNGMWIILSCGNGENNNLFIVKSDATETIQITQGNFHDNYPRWSPDGQSLIFIRQGRTNRFSQYQHDVYIFSIIDNEVYSFTNDDNYEYFPSWSKDGNQVSMSISNPNDAIVGSDLWVSDYITTDFTQVTNNARILSSNWINNEMLLYTTANELYMLNIAENNSQIIARTGSLDNAVASPNDDWVAVTFSEDGFGRDIGIVDIKGGEEIQKVTNFQGVSSYPYWSNDGSKIYFLHNQRIYQYTLSNEEVDILIDLSKIFECGVYSYDIYEK